jgi:glycosyl hydrolase family 123
MKIVRSILLILALALAPGIGYAQTCLVAGTIPILAGITPLCSPTFVSRITAAWANDGGDKVTQDELRATVSPTSVYNSVWDGTTIKQFGAKNEVVSFNLILEAGNAVAPTVAVTLSNLTCTSCVTIRSDQTRSSANLFNWTTTEAELFYVRYLQLRGLSPFAFGTLSGGNLEPQVPFKQRLPLIGGGYPGVYTDRPNANKYYPDIAVPLELVPTFAIASGHNQSIWVDIYIPKTATTGLYTGTMTVTESGTATKVLPVNLSVRGFTLPDIPNSKTMIYSVYGDVTQRYTGTTFPTIGSAADLLGRQVLDNQRYVAHRHKLSMIGDDADFSSGAPVYTTNPSSAYQPFLTGTAFVSGNGYAGPGVSTGNNVYSIGTYGAWKTYTGWTAMTQAQFNTNTNAWETWFQANSPTTERFVYLADESRNWALVQRWANWMATNPGVGVSLKSLSTVPAVPRVDVWSAATAYIVDNVVLSGTTLYVCILANTNQAPPNATYWNVYFAGPTGAYTAIANLEPDVHLVTSTFNAGLTSAWTSSVTAIEGTSNYGFWMYNGSRPGQGVHETEGDGPDLRSRSWGQYKKGVGRWFEWESTYYNDNQCGSGQSDLFVESRTFCHGPGNNIKGLYGNNSDGLLFYPGTDAVYPAQSYGISGPIASLRLKHWRRGVQDVDYIVAAAAINPSAVATIVSNMMPLFAWELTVHDSADPTYYLNTPASWSSNPDDWEAQRLALAHIIDGL